MHAPDYQLTYIEATIQSLDLRGMTIIPSDILTALWALDVRGMRDADAETALYSFLYRLTPHHLGTYGEHIRFPGWAALHAELAGKSVEELARRFGHDAVRVAVVVRDANRSPHSLAA